MTIADSKGTQSALLGRGSRCGKILVEVVISINKAAKRRFRQWDVFYEHGVSRLAPIMSMIRGMQADSRLSRINLDIVSRLLTAETFKSNGIVEGIN